MNPIKVNDFCNAYAKALELDDEIKYIIIELMQKIITKYEKIVPTIPASVEVNSNTFLIKPTNGAFSTEDFFLNKLMRNIWSVTGINQYMIDEGFADIHTKGNFNPGLHEVSFNTAKLDSQLNKYSDLFKAEPERFSRIKNTAKKKVIMHELEHGLQTRYNDILDVRNREKYRKISVELSKMPQYKSILRTYDSIPKQLAGVEEYLSTGTHVGASENQQNGRTYRDINGFDYLNEILNETESLEITGQEIFLRKSIGSDGNGYLLRNPESSNSSITNYGDLLKAVFGDRNSFKLMYIDPIGGFQKFNSMYNDVFQQVYGSDGDAIELFITAITEIKEKGLETEHLKLCEALSKCLEKRINNFYNDKNTSNEQMMNAIKIFEMYSVSNNDKDKNSQLEHIKILESLKQKVSARDLSNIQTSQVTTEKGEDDLKPMPTFDEIKNCSERYVLTYDSDNSVKIIDGLTNEVVTDKNIEKMAIFSNIWLSSAGLKRDNDNGESYAFNDGAKETYDFLVNASNFDISNNGNLNSIELFKNAENLRYKHSQEIIARLFRSDYQSKFIDNFFRERVKTDKLKTEEVVTLYNLIHAGKLAYGNTDNNSEEIGKPR